VKGPVLKAVLKSLDDFGRGHEAFPSVETIAQDVNYSERHVKRAIEGLEGLSLITKNRKSRRMPDGQFANLNHYRIVWTELALLVPNGTDQSASGTDQSASGTDQSASGTDQSATSGTQKGQEARKEPPPPPPANVDGDWSEVEAALNSCELKTARETVHLAERDGYTPAEIIDAIKTYKANRDKLASPGALVWWMKHDRQWPSDDNVRDWREIEAAKERRENERRAKAAGRIAYQIVKDGRKAGKSDEQITVELDAAGVTWDGEPKCATTAS